LKAYPIIYRLTVYDRIQIFGTNEILSFHFKTDCE
jgi:hypothetical protein